MATHGHGTTLAGGTAGTIGNILSVDIGGRARDSLDSSDMDSTDKFREFISGMADEGDLTVEVNYDGANAGIADALDTAYQLGTAETWTITWPDGSTFVCSGFITSLGVATPFEDKITQSLTIKLSGKGTYSAASP